MITLAEELQATIFSILNGDNTLKKDLGVVGVYDKVPDNEAYPYIRFEKVETTDFDNHTDSGFAGDVMLKVFDRSDSSIRTKRIMSRMYQLLHDFEPDMDNFKKIVFKCTISNDTLENDSRTQNGTQVYDFIFARK